MGARPHFNLGDKILGFEVDGFGRGDHRGAPAFRYDLVDHKGGSVGRLTLTQSSTVVRDDVVPAWFLSYIDFDDDLAVYGGQELDWIVPVAATHEDKDKTVVIGTAEDSLALVVDESTLLPVKKLIREYVKAKPKTIDMPGGKTMKLSVSATKPTEVTPGYVKTKKVIAKDLTEGPNREVYHNGDWHKFGAVVKSTPLGQVFVYGADDGLCENEPIAIVGNDDVLPVRTKSA